MAAIREVRPIWPVAGMGGVITAEWVEEFDYTPSQPGNLEVEQWEIVHDYDNIELPLSGGRGSPSRLRVGDDFEFVCDVLLDMKPAKERGSSNTFAGQPFLDGRLEGFANDESRFYLSLVFQVADPLIWWERATTGLQYRCPRVLLTQTRTRDSSKGDPADGCVRATVRGHGSAPLERWIDNDQVGLGGLGF